MNYIYDYICIIRLIDFTVYVIFPSVWVFVQLANDKTRWTIKSEQNLGEVTHNALTVFWNETFTFWSSFQLRHIMHSTFLRNSDIFFKFLFSLFNETAHYWYYLRRSFIYWGGGCHIVTFNSIGEGQHLQTLEIFVTFNHLFPHIRQCLL